MRTRQPPPLVSEFENLMDYVVYVSATPGDYELAKSEGIIVEQVIGQSPCGSH